MRFGGNSTGVWEEQLPLSSGNEKTSVLSAETRPDSTDYKTSRDIPQDGNLHRNDLLILTLP